MSELQFSTEVIKDENVFEVLNEFWNRAPRPPFLEYLFVAGSSINGGRIVRREHNTLNHSDIDITTVARIKNEKDLQDLEKYIVMLKAFLQAKKQLKKLEYEDIHVSSSRIFDLQIPEDPLSPAVVEKMFSTTIDNILADRIVQMCLPTIPESAGENNKKQFSAMLKRLQTEDPDRFQVLSDLISSKWTEKMRLKRKYYGVNEQGNQYVESDVPRALAANLRRVLLGQ